MTNKQNFIQRNENVELNHPFFQLFPSSFKNIRYQWFFKCASNSSYNLTFWKTLILSDTSLEKFNASEVQENISISSEVTWFLFLKSVWSCLKRILCRTIKNFRHENRQVLINKRDFNSQWQFFDKSNLTDVSPSFKRSLIKLSQRYTFFIFFQ